MIGGPPVHTPEDAVSFVEQLELADVPAELAVAASATGPVSEGQCLC